MTLVSVERARLLAEARSWLGTPFHHGARVKGAGVDCAQLLIACYVETGVVDPFDPGFYSADWFLHDSGEALDRFRSWVERTCVAVDHPAAGDLLLFHYGRAESHGAIYIGDDRVIHSFRGRGVIEEQCGSHTPLGLRRSSAWTPRRWAFGETTSDHLAAGIP